MPSFSRLRQAILIASEHILSGETHSILDTISTEVWRRGLFDKLSGLSGFDALTQQSRFRNKNAAYFSVLNGLLPQAQRVIGAYDLNEITAARQYYNNEHLLHFWRNFNTRLDELIGQGMLDASFPLFDVTLEPDMQTYRPNPVPVETFDSIEIDVNDPSLRQTGPSSRGTPVLLSPARVPARPEQSALDRLFLKMSLINKIELKTMRALYDLFIEQHRKTRGAVWDYYRIHFFLDNYLYVRADGMVRRSHFDFIFLNNTLYELKIYLQDRFDKERHLTLDDVNTFLRRQRQFYAKTALSISLVGNEIHNNRKDLLVYDEKAGVVLAKGVTDSLREHYRENVVEGYRLIRQGGCPFARSIGLKKNALIEVFEYTDTLMSRLLGHAEEFRTTFQA